MAMRYARHTPPDDQISQVKGFTALKPADVPRAAALLLRLRDEVTSVRAAAAEKRGVAEVVKEGAVTIPDDVLLDYDLVDTPCSVEHRRTYMDICKLHVHVLGQ